MVRGTGVKFNPKIPALSKENVVNNMGTNKYNHRKWFYYYINTSIQKKNVRFSLILTIFYSYN